MIIGVAMVPHHVNIVIMSMMNLPNAQGMIGKSNFSQKFPLLKCSCFFFFSALLHTEMMTVTMSMSHV